MVVQLSILVSNNDSLMGLGYSRVEVWQSLDDGDTYQELTAASSQGATLTSLEASTTFQMGGRLLKFIISGGSEQSVTFDPELINWTPHQVANRINEVVSGFAAVVDECVVLTAPTAGRASSIEITYNDADSLGLDTGTKSYGLDARLAMSSGTLLYTYYDVAGLSTARYRWRFSNNGASPFSDYSAYVLGSAVPLISAGSLSVGSATFVSLDGQPRKTKLVIALDQNPSSVSGMILTSGQPLVIESDALGFIQFTLIRGASVRVAIEGTYFVREFVVPNTASFDLITVMAAAPDVFTVQTVPPFLIRRTL